MVGAWRKPRVSDPSEGQCQWRRNWINATTGTSGIIEDDMSEKNKQ
jgi:hypothetical protein